MGEAADPKPEAARTALGLGAPPRPSLLEVIAEASDAVPARAEPGDPARGSAGRGTLASIELGGLFATSPDAVRRRLLGPWAEGLRQYLALRLGDLEAASATFDELKEIVARREVSELVKEPGAKANVYRLARELVRRERPAQATTPRATSTADASADVREPAPSAAGSSRATASLRDSVRDSVREAEPSPGERSAAARSLEPAARSSASVRRASRASARPYAGLAFRPPLRAHPGYAQALERIRTTLDAAQAELVELRWARELVPSELSHVLGEPELDVMRRLGAAVVAVRAILGSLADGARGGDPVATAVLDAFALARSPASTTVHPRGGSAAGLAPGTRVGGRYKVVERVGTGSFGEVYRADDEDVPGHRVALKILREPALSQAARDEHLRELKVIAAVFHPSVVHFKDHGWLDDRLWFVMPWYEGETLEARIRRTGGLGRAEARRIFEPLARALATLHSSGIRHQDIKPDNVILARIKGLATEGGGDAEGILPILLDLGVAATEHEALIGGTPVYFAPEVAAQYAGHKDDEREIGPKADVFALALALRNALEPETEEDVPAGAVEAFIARRARERPPLPTRRELRYLDRLFGRALSLDPNERPSADEFARDLAALTAPEEKAARRRRTLQWAVPTLVAVASAFGALFYVLVREQEMRALEVGEARMDAAAARADLMVEEARRLALDQDHAVLLAEYEDSRLSRAELASGLATAEGQLAILGDRLAGLIAERDLAQADLALTRGRLVAAESVITTARNELTSEFARRMEVEETLAELERRTEGRVASIEAELGRARAREDELEAELAVARAAADDEAERVRLLEVRIADADAARERAEGSLREIEESISTLRRHIAEVPGETASAPVEPAPPAAEL